jgi:hypothetical protein
VTRIEQDLMSFPMLADFAIRLACGLAMLLLIAPWRIIPPAFFRTHSQVILGLLVLAALDLSQDGVRGRVAACVVAAAVLAFVASFVWGLGLPRVAVPINVVLVLISGGVLVSVSLGGGAALGALNAAGRLVSSFLMGATLTAMLLGHHYLTAPAMSIEPLKRFVRCMAWGLGTRALLAALGWWVWHQGIAGSHGGDSVSPFFLAIRWGMGFAGPLLATVLTWKTVEIRSTQSATGILYIAMTLVLFGELSALILARGAGVVF